MDATKFLEQMRELADRVQATASSAPPFVEHLTAHFERNPASLPIVTESFAVAEHPNLHLALEAFASAPGNSSSLKGFATDRDRYGFRFTDLLLPGQDAPIDGPVQYRNVEVDEGNVIPCVQRGVYLLRAENTRLAVLVRGPSDHDFPRMASLDVMAVDRAEADTFLATIRNGMKKRNVYRGRVLSLEGDCNRGVSIKARKLPRIERDQIILPGGLLDRIERQSIQFARHATRLKDSGQHLRRGILLYGPPGTGKTLSAMYLASQMPGRTVLLVTGQGMGLIAEACAMARSLQPSTVILEDVDLVAAHRTNQTTGTNAVLFELLNEMDGLAEDCDVLFLLTTNRPDILEPALGARPGRIDVALEVPVPDAECRKRLFELYGKGLTLEATNIEDAIKRTEGVSAAFIRELMRKAALAAADDGERLVIQNRHLDEAMHELLVEGGVLMRTLLGGSSSSNAVRSEPSA